MLAFLSTILGWLLKKFSGPSKEQIGEAVEAGKTSAVAATAEAAIAQAEVAAPKTADGVSAKMRKGTF